MLDRIQIESFRGFDRVVLEQTARVNLLVGDNGSGKTTVLEALLLALSSQTESAMRVRALRGFEPQFQGTPQGIERALWSDMFHNGDMSRPISISLIGAGKFTRGLRISRRRESESFLPFDSEAQASEPVSFTWTNYTGETVTVSPRVTSEGLKLPVAFDDENLSFYVPSTVNPSQTETAQRFSDLSQQNEHERFVELFRKEYRWVQDISIELTGSVPALFARTSRSKHKVPLPNVSGGINRILSVLLAIYTSPRTVVMIDEIENGQYYSHLDGIWRLIFDFAEMANSQIFVTSHSRECIESLGRVAKGRRQDEVALHQLTRASGGYSLHSFSGKDAALALKYGEEIR